MLKRIGFRDSTSKVCVENGCGLGRVTLALAKRFKKVHGYDISPNHLKRAEEYATQRGVKNVSFHLSPIDSVADGFEDCDFFYSRLVLQHNPPPVIRELIAGSLKALRPNGVAIFQVPTYRVGYSFRIKDYIARPRVREIEMHCLPQSEVFSVIADAGCNVIEVAQDNAIGGYGEWISDTFVVQRSGNSKRATA
jgi:SAM-dependent methyltransferase